MAITMEDLDPRIYTDLKHLQQLEGDARGLSFLPRQPARSILNGQHASKLRGRGLNFEELRSYLPGDDIRAIDWKATARKQEPHVRVYTEERDRPALLIVDQRQSMFFGTRHCMKSVTAAEIAAATAFMVLGKGDRIGGIVFDDTEISEFKPQRSRRALNSLLKGIEEKNLALKADTPPLDNPMPLNKPLRAASRIARHDHLVIIISDFYEIDDETLQHTTNMARGNDVCLMLVHDPWSTDMPKDLSIVASDGQLQVTLDTTTEQSWKRLSEAARSRIENVIDWQRSVGVPVFPITSGEPTIPQLHRLLGATPASLDFLDKSSPS